MSILQGKNRLSGMLGALLLEMPVSGLKFEVGTGFTDNDRNWAGAKIRWPLGTVRCSEYICFASTLWLLIRTSSPITRTNTRQRQS